MVGGMLAETRMHTVALVQEVTVAQENQASLVTVEMALEEGKSLHFEEGKVQL